MPDGTGLVAGAGLSLRLRAAGQFQFTSISPVRPARCWPWSARLAQARARRCTASLGCTGRRSAVYAVEEGCGSTRRPA